MNPDIGIIDLSKLIAEDLNISAKQLTDLINKNLTPEEISKSGENHRNKIDVIIKLLQSDREINNFGNSLNAQNDNFNRLKNNLGKLQVLILLKKIDKSKNCDEILNTFITLINNKISIINDITGKKLNNKLVGGNKNDKEYIKKYIKYKLKYLQLKY
jgi:hypothetical protein